MRATAFPLRPVRCKVFTQHQTVGEHRYCTEFVLEDATIEAHPLLDLLAPQGESLIVAGTAPTLKVHLHTGRPDDVQAQAAKHGRLTRVKVEDMAQQHHLLVVDAPAKPFSIAAVVPGAGFERIARELGADVTIASPRGVNPSVEDLLIGVNATLADQVCLLANDANVALAAREVPALTDKTVVVVPTRDVVQGLAVQLALAGCDELPHNGALEAALREPRTASVFFAGNDATRDGVAVRRGTPAASIDGRLISAPTLDDVLRETALALGAGGGGLITLYYGGKQRERDAQRYAAALAEALPSESIEYYYGGQTGIEYWMSLE